MIHMLVVSAVEEAELLLAVGGVVGGIDIVGQCIMRERPEYAMRQR